MKETSFSVSAFCSWHVCFRVFPLTKKNCSVFCSKEGNHTKTSILKQLPSIPKNLLPFCWRSMRCYTAMVLSPPFNQKRFFMSALAYLKLELRDLSVGQAPDNYQFSHRLLVKVIVDLKLVTWCYVVLHVPLMQLLSSKLLPHSSWWSFTIIIIIIHYPHNSKSFPI